MIKCTLHFFCLHIESHSEQKKKWEAFKRRNLLRKLDLALNQLQLSKDEINAASSYTLQMIAVERKDPVYAISVPAPEEDFPEFSTKKSAMFPLPISHENQCTIAGAASNLELFAGEFDFKAETKKKFLPLKQSGKEFDLDRAYQRFAFNKMLEQHKKKQAQYEGLLRNEDLMQDNVCAIEVSLEESSDSDYGDE